MMRCLISVTVTCASSASWLMLNARTGPRPLAIWIGSAYNTRNCSSASCGVGLISAASALYSHTGMVIVIR